MTRRGGTYDLDWHLAPRGQYIVNLDGAVKITASDGEARVRLIAETRGVAGLTVPGSIATSRTSH